MLTPVSELDANVVAENLLKEGSSRAPDYKGIPSISLPIASVAKLCERRALVESDMLGLAALDLVLRHISARVMGITFGIEVADIPPDDRAADVPGLGIPAHAIADFKGIRHNASP
jgi:hypothetical protein